MDCLDSRESLALYESSSPAVAVLIIPYYIFHYCPNGFCSASEAVVSFISPVSLSALSSRDEALGPVYPSCFVDYCCFLFTGRETLLNLLPSHRYLHYPPSSRFLLVCHVTLTPCSPFSLRLNTAHLPSPSISSKCSQDSQTSTHNDSACVEL